LKEII